MKNNQDIIIITADGTSSWMRERFTPGSWVRMFSEGLIGSYKDKMEVLRRVDNGVAVWLKDLDGLVKEMKEASKNSRYIDVAIILSKIDKRLLAVREAGKEIKQLTDAEIAPFDLEHKKDLSNEKLFADDGLSSEAGMFGDMKRRFVADRLETQVRAERKMAINSLVDKTQQLVNSIKEKYSDLGKARAKGDIKGYIDTLANISISQREFQQYFTPVYKKYLQPLVDRAQEERRMLQEENLKKQETKEMVAKEFDKKPEEGILPEAKSPALNLNQTWQKPEQVSNWILDKKETPVAQAPKKPASPRKPKAPKPIPAAEEEIKASNANFISELIKASSLNDPYILSNMLVRYAEKIEDIDLDKSLKLLAIAEGILG